MKKSLKLISALLAAMMSVTMTFTAHANPPKNSQNIQSSQSNSLIKISSLEDLNHLRDLSDQGENFEGKTVILENDIYITKDGKKDGEPIEFKPIFKCPNDAEPNDDDGFKGIFDGNGKTLHFNSTNSNIFGSIAKGGVVKNLNITGRFEGGQNRSIVAAKNSGTMDNVNVDVVASNDAIGIFGICYENAECGIIKNCEVKGNLSSTCCLEGSAGMFLNGGICGNNDGVIESCKVSADLTSRVCNEAEGMAETGGIASFNRGIIRSCFVESNIINLNENSDDDLGRQAAGLVSTNNGLVENSTFNGNISSLYAGGIAGNNYGVLKSCKANAIIAGQIPAGLVLCNKWGDPIFSSNLYKETAEGKGPQGVVNGCEFVGSLKSITGEQVAIYGNIGLLTSDNTKFDPEIINCKMNGENIIRGIDKYYNYN